MKRRTIGRKETGETRRERKCSRKQAQTQGAEVGDNFKRKNACFYQETVLPFTMTGGIYLGEIIEDDTPYTYKVTVSKGWESCSAD